MIKAKVITKPKISVNKLGEYLTCINPSRRRKILEEQKYPKKGFGQTRYKEAREAIVKYIISGYDKSIIEDAKNIIKSKTAITDFEKSDKSSSVEVLESVLKTDFPDFKGAKLSRYKGKNPKITLSNVEISIMPDIIVKVKDKIGCLKVHIIKTHPLNSESQKYVSTLLQEFTETYLVDDKQTKPDSKLSVSIDCFGKTHEIAPKSVLLRKSKIQDACKEIASMWESV